MISETILSRSSADPNSTMIRPRLLLIWIVTLVASCLNVLAAKAWDVRRISAGFEANC